MFSAPSRIIHRHCDIQPATVFSVIQYQISQVVVLLKQATSWTKFVLIRRSGIKCVTAYLRNGRRIKCVNKFCVTDVRNKRIKCVTKNV